MSHDTFVNSVISNAAHVVPITFYSLLGAATKTDIPKIGHVTSILPITFFITNAIARYDETNTLVQDQHARAHHHHEILADFMVNGGIAAASATAVGLLGAATALPMVGVFAATDFFVAGDNSPMDYLKSGITNTLDTILGDLL